MSSKVEKNTVADKGKSKLELRCPLCKDKVYSDIEKYLKHQKSDIANEINKKKQLLCHECPYSSAVIDHLRKHIFRHVGVKPFECPLCNWTCVTKFQLTRHHLNYHVRKLQNHRAH